WFPQLRLVLAEVVPDRIPESGCASDDRQDEERDLPALKREEHRFRCSHAVWRCPNVVRRLTPSSRRSTRWPREPAAATFCPPGASLPSSLWPCSRSASDGSSDSRAM